MDSDLGLPVDDLAHAADLVGPDAWRRLDGARVLVTGGTGFVGTWLLAAVLHATREAQIPVRLLILSRSPESFRRSFPGLAEAPEVTLVAGDVRQLEVPPGGVTHVVHAAADVVASKPPRETFDVLATGTRRVLAQAVAAGASDLLLVSSGAIYGPQPTELEAMSELYLGAPPTAAAASAYGEGKRVSEWLAHQAAGDGVATRVARCFAFVGPHLPLDASFAIGNFIGDALAGQSIEVQGDGTAVRTYLHAADLAGWLWATLLRGAPGVTYNVGGSEVVSMVELAERVNHVVGSSAGVRVLHQVPPGSSVSRYVPDVSAIRQDLALTDHIGLDEAVARTVAWHRRRGGN